jgi:hypothetical protein
VRVLRTATDANPALGPATYPLIALWVLFVVASWTAVPLSNFILSRTAVGRRPGAAMIWLRAMSWRGCLVWSSVSGVRGGDGSEGLWLLLRLRGRPG